MSDAVDRLLGGDSHPSCSFLEPGRTYEGVILSDREVQAREFGTKELKFWTDGSPVMVAVFDIQTKEFDPSIEDDDGIRSLYIDKKGLREAVGQAFRASGVKRGDTVIGGTLKVRFDGYGQAKQGQANPPKKFQARFIPGQATAVSALVDEFSAEPVPPAYAPDEEPF